MPIIKEFDVKDIVATDDEYTLYTNKGVNYLFSVVEDMTVVDIYLPLNLYNQNDFIGSLSFFNDYEYPVIDLSFTSDKCRRQGHMYNLYEFLIQKYGGLISDTQVSVSAFMLWNKLKLKYNVQEYKIADDHLDAPTRFIAELNVIYPRQFQKRSEE